MGKKMLNASRYFTWSTSANHRIVKCTHRVKKSPLACAKKIQEHWKCSERYKIPTAHTMSYKFKFLTLLQPSLHIVNDATDPRSNQGFYINFSLHHTSLSCGITAQSGRRPHWLSIHCNAWLTGSGGWTFCYMHVGQNLRSWDLCNLKWHESHCFRHSWVSSMSFYCSFKGFQHMHIAFNRSFKPLRKGQI